MARKYPPRDIKLLFGRSAGYCAYPGCRIHCLVDSNALDRDAITGDIAHIIAHSKKGPRGKANLTPAERDCYENWVLLCATHHRLVDGQANTFSSSDLQRWKDELERWVSTNLRGALASISFAELEVVCRAIVTNQTAGLEDLSLTPPREKIAKNGLERVASYISLGLAQAWQVKDYLEKQAMIDPNFPERLKAGFVQKYRELVAQKHDSVTVFEELRVFAAGVGADFKMQAASLAVLAYLFEACEIFER